MHNTLLNYLTDCERSLRYRLAGRSNLRQVWDLDDKRFQYRSIY